ncbi:unnamed protein product, partial [Dicrocoelium dendriticum]
MDSTTGRCSCVVHGGRDPISLKLSVIRTRQRKFGMQCVLIGLPDRGLRQFLSCQLEETLGAPPGNVHGETTAYQGMIRVDAGIPVRATIQDGTTPPVTYGVCGQFESIAGQLQEDA